MKPIWIIENLVKEESFLELSRAAHDLGYFVLDLRGDYSKSLLQGLPEGPVIANGSIGFHKMLHADLKAIGREPSLPITWDNYKCSWYYPRYAEYLFNDNHVFVSLSELKRRKFFFYGIFGRESMLFVRPDDGDKSFKGSLVDLEEFDRFYDHFDQLKNEMVVVSNPKNIRGEWRFVVSSEIIAQSCYKYQDKIVRIPSAPKGAIELVEKLLALEKPDKVFCFDICEDNDGDFWLLELTSFASAGLYACDKRAIVEKLSSII